MGRTRRVPGVKRYAYPKQLQWHPELLITKVRRTLPLNSSLWDIITSINMCQTTTVIVWSQKREFKVPGQRNLLRCTQNTSIRTNLGQFVSKMVLSVIKPGTPHTVLVVLAVCPQRSNVSGPAPAPQLFLGCSSHNSIIILWTTLIENHV